MKIINLVMPSVLVSTLFAGCVMPSENDPVTDDNDPASTDGVLDGRAAAEAEAQALGISDLPLNLTSWYSGSVAPGGTQHWYWNNSSLTAAYQVGLSPIGASTSNACNFEVTRTWDVQNYGGEREFHFIIQNTGAITCGANILLDSTQRLSTWATGGLNPGASKSWTWNNANPLDASYFVGVSPSGATSSNPCELEVTRTWYDQQPGGERELKFTVKNAGAIACQGDIQLARTSSVPATWSTGTLAAGASKSWTWNNANPLDRIYVPGLSPDGASGLTACVLEVTQSYYRQVINADGSAERELHLTVSNVGSLACFGTVLLNNVP